MKVKHIRRAQWYMFWCAVLIGALCVSQHIYAPAAACFMFALFAWPKDAKGRWKIQ